MKAPSMIIGVGGIGSEICAKIADMLPENSPDRDVFSFVIMDTDINTIRDLERKGYHGLSILLTDNMTVGKCLAMMKKRTENWYPDNQVLERKSMTEGAGQQRAISRLAFEYALAYEKFSLLQQEIHRLNELVLEDCEQEIRFYIISSLAGGTGSGIVVPLAVYLNNLVSEARGDRLSLCKGFFMLSSALRDSVDSELERRSLDSNAYAAVKELSYFMELSDRNKEADEDIDIPGLPDIMQDAIMKDQNTLFSTYEYCFLFGMNNEKGRGLHSFEDLKRLIADAVYMQACSPIHERNSSREDNKLRHGLMQMQEKGVHHLSRFGGIGCGELVYPYEQLKHFYGLSRAREVMHTQWKQYDLPYQRKLEEQIEKKREGKVALTVLQSEEYINAVMHADETDGLAEEIKDVCMTSNHMPIWTEYLNALHRVAIREIDLYRENGAMGCSQLEEDLVHGIADTEHNAQNKKELRADINQFIELYQKLEPEILGTAGKVISGIKDKLFKLHSIGEEIPESYMEYWFTQKEGFIHPNAVRYFLYHVRQALPERIEQCKFQKKRAENKFRNLSKEKPFESVWYSKRKAIKVREKIKQGLEALYDYEKADLYQYILEACDIYTAKLTDNFEWFYRTYPELLSDLETEVLMLEEELDRTRGITRAYVCANKKCREAVLHQMRKDKHFTTNIPGVSYKLYELLQNPVQNRIQAQKLFEEVKEYWINGLEKEYGHLIKHNILRALDMQAFYETGFHLNETSMQKKIQEVQQTLISPFLQYNRSQNLSQGISICCYNSELKNENGYYRHVLEWLKSHEGIEDEIYCSPYQIIFYRSFVGLDAHQILEYVHKGSTLDTVKTKPGHAFLAYEKMLQDRGHCKNGKPGITPHIDKRWHNLKYMPDSDAVYQKQKETQIAVAFLYAFIKRYLTGNPEAYKLVIPGENIYEISKKRLKDCYDYFYENHYAVDILLRKLEVELADAHMDGSDPFAVINPDQKGIFSLFWCYFSELKKGERKLDKEQLMLDAAAWIVAQCADGENRETLEMDYQNRLQKEIQNLNEEIDSACKSDTEKRQIGELVKEKVENHFRT